MQKDERKPGPGPGSESVAAAPGAGALRDRIADAVREAGGWLPFDRYMEMALYTPGLGYYANDSLKFGTMPGSGSDFVTAPELSPLFGRTVARQVRQMMVESGTAEVWEFGAGAGTLAVQLLSALGTALLSYHIVDLSGVLRERQRERILAEAPEFADKVQWHDRLPDEMRGIVVGNEVLDAMPVKLLHFDGTHWFERGVRVEGAGFAWEDRPTGLRPPFEGPFLPGTVTEVHPHAEAFVRTLGQVLVRGGALLIDYGFPEAEYYHPQRAGGTLMCHRAHRADPDPLEDPGLKDITAHVNFTGIAVAAQESGFDVIGYASQGRFLLNTGILDLLPAASEDAAADAQRLRQVAMVHKLVNEHEMGELFKVLALARGFEMAPMGFAQGDRTHLL
ncbi:class I SAM-dependent methyltransferase [Caldimonas tepidiphila]|uniref:class I SAM-dependent methyltransferase n=1 Tax=Caldimonas tepidiphila TaxID=2315841 RepID=UPI000E5A3B9A|nr:SAM-dependent methyltransferase [Caldimonas tepidiphila]